MKQKGDRRTDDVAVGFVRNHSALLGRSVRSIYRVEKNMFSAFPRAAGGNLPCMHM